MDGTDESGEVAHIYTFFAGLDVPEPNTVEHRMATTAANTLDEAVEMLENALAANYEDESVMAAINSTSDLLFYGVEPDRGLDQLDLMLIRKMNLRHVLGTNQPTCSSFFLVTLRVSMYV
jgi:hypothetical protein